MKIAILTLPLHTNYGGILQAYALQTVLERMGHEVVLIRKQEADPFDILKHPYRLLRRCVKKLLHWRTTDFFVEKHSYERHQRRLLKFKEFIKIYLHSRYFDSWSEISSWDIESIIVGSDQVWRPFCFGPEISHAFLDFAEGMQIKRIAYAVSFGTDKWEYSEEDTSKCKRLVTLFDAISVREQSAISLCEQNLGISPELVLDPTLLLTMQDYSKFSKSGSCVRSKYIMKYCLDNSLDADAIVDSLVSDGYEIVAPISSDIIFDWNSNIIPESIEFWLDSIRNAEIVVTDSYHCMVFSILFHKNVLVVQNSFRGNTRISSLLGILGVRERVVTSIDDYRDRYSTLMSGVNWEEIDARLDSYRESSLNYLLKSLD